MIVYAVDVFVKEGCGEDFIEATAKNRAGTRKEKGNIQFDLSRSADEPGKFLLYEVYEDEEAVQSHKQTPHYLEWRESVETMMASPRKGRMYEPILCGES